MSRISSLRSKTLRAFRSLADEQAWAKNEEQKIVDAAALFSESYEKQFDMKGIAAPTKGGSVFT